ncbi:MAG TPA: 2OG-Fe(II) oxygenase [Allosphingosinicella sp.]|nr:2OG-Fe(II) oxygenase [Allosphingosinicella sp.]
MQIAGQAQRGGAASLARAKAARLLPGDHAPWFEAPALSGSPNYKFDSVAGRHVLMLFFGSTLFEGAGEALSLVQRNRSLFDDRQACFFGVSIDPRDQKERSIEQQLPGIRYFLDYNVQVSGRFGATDFGGVFTPFWLVLDQALQVVASFPLSEGQEAIRTLRDCLEAPTQDLVAPVLFVPRVFDPSFCRRLIEEYEKSGGEESGFMREVEGKTVLVTDPQHKQRRDHLLDNDLLQKEALSAMNRRLSPALAKAFNYCPTRVERHLVACYSPGAGHFRPHRDNSTKGTAHRRFAVTINLNSDEYSGGELRFPEFGRRLYKPPTGGALVFSCSLMHEALPVKAGRRFAYLPFLYDEQAAAIREANNPHLGEGLGAYSRKG